MVKSAYLIPLLFALCFSGCTAKTMNRVMSSWKGATADELIAAWGYPGDDRVIAGRRLVTWYQDNGIDYSLGWRWAPPSASRKYCNRTVELNSQMQVVGFQWEGTDCPKVWSEWERKQPVVITANGAK